MARQHFHVGERVRWNWGTGQGHGTIRECFERTVTRKLKGSEITRHGTPEEPACLIEQDDGDQVLKSASELEKDS